MREHCCQQMVRHLADQEVPVEYSGQFREYQLVAVNQRFVQVLSFCPWCGAKLPPDLRDVWGSRLDDLGLFDPFGDDRDRIPLIFRDDTWWRLENL